MHSEGRSTGTVTFWMGSHWAGEAHWTGDGYSVKTRSGHEFHSPSYFEAETSVEALWGVLDAESVERPCPGCGRELFTTGYYVEQVDDGTGTFVDYHVRCVPPRRQS